MDQPSALLSPAEKRFETWRRKLGFAGGPMLLVALWLVPLPALSEPAHRLLAILGLVGVWWLSEAVPLAVTALLGPALCVAAGIVPAREALRPFADPVIFLFLGGFLLAEGMVKHGLNRRIAFAVLSIPRVGDSPVGLYAGFGLLTAFISAWVSNTATAAMMLPIAISVLRELATRERRAGGGEPDWRSLGCASGLILVTAFAASVGGLATPIGTPPNLIGVGLIERTLGYKLSFFEWMRFGLPATLVLTGLLVWRLSRANRHRGGWSQTGADWIRSEGARLGPWSWAELQVALVFLLAVGLWVLPGVVALLAGTDAPLAIWLNGHLPEGVVAMLAAVILFALPNGTGEGDRVLSWTDAGRIDWGTILLFGGGMALGELAFTTGLARWIGEGVAAALPWKSVWTFTLLFTLVGTLVSEATSNTASATMIIPLAMAVAQAAGVDPLQPALGACLGCSLGFMLPVSTPPNALAYGTGAVPLTRMIRHGLWLDLAGGAVVVAVVLLLSPR